MVATGPNSSSAQSRRAELADPSAPQPAVSPPTPGAPSGPPIDVRPLKRRNLQAAGLLLVAVVCLVAQLLWTSPFGHKSSSSRTSIGSGAAVVPGSASPSTASTSLSALDQASSRAAASWIRANLRTSAVLAADSTTAGMLRPNGIEGVYALPTTLTQARSVQYLVTSSSSKASPSLRAAATPIATFGSPGHMLTVEQLVRTPTGQSLAALVARDREARQLAGSQLATNPGIRTTPATKSALRGGELDLRAATVLALLAQSAPVRLDRVDEVEAEHRAHMPARMITITVADPQAVVSRLRRLSDPYTPDVRQISSSALTVRWLVDVASALPIR